MSRGIENRLAGVDGGIEDGHEIDGLPAHLDQSARDPRHFEQIVDEAHEVIDLSFHHRAKTSRHRLGRARRLQELHGREQRREWIAQFVPERGEEFILASIGQPQGGLRPGAFGEMLPNLILTFACPQRAPYGGDQRRHANGPLDERDIAQHPHRFGRCP